MATEGTTQVFGGTPSVRYTAPRQSGAANEYGLYAWSFFKARLSSLNGSGNVIANATITNADTINALLFTSDIPGRIETLAQQAAATTPSHVGDLFNATAVPFLYTLSGGATTVTAQYGQVAAGYTGTASSVFCTGFLASGVLSVATSGTVNSVDLIVTANGAVVSSPVAPLNPAGVLATATLTAPQPIIFPAASYTAAIRDAENLFVDPIGQSWLIVGLYTVVSD